MTTSGPDDVETDLNALIDILLRVVPGYSEKCERGSVRDWALGFCLKFTQHAISAVTLIRDGSAQRQKSQRFVDGPSACVLARAGWECFLLFHRVFVLPQDDQEREMYYLRWSIESPRRRQGFVEVDAGQAQQKAKEKELIDAREDQIRANPWFQKLSHDEQEQFLRPGDGWRGKWTQLATNAGIAKLYGSSHYSWLCDQAHSGWFSVADLKGSMSPEDTQRLIQVTIGILAVGMANVLVGLETLFPGSRSGLTGSERALLDNWFAIGRIKDAEIQQIREASLSPTDPRV